MTEDELLLKRSLVGMLLLFAFSGVIMQILQSMGYSKDPFPSWILIAVILILLFVSYILDSQITTVNVFNTFLVVVLVSACIDTGGIYSYNLKWFIVIFFMSLLFLPRYQIIIWFFVVSTIIIIIYLYKLGDSHAILDLDDKTYFFENLIFYFVTALFVYVTFRAQDLLKKSIYSKNDNLKKYSNELRKQSGELEFLTHQLRESNDKLVNFAHTTSHDLKQPLNTLSSFSKLVIRDIENDNISNKTHEMLEFIQSSSVQIKELINSTLDSSKLSTIRKDDNQFVNIKDVLEDVLGRLDFQINESRARIIYDSMPSMFTNYHQISRVFQNLLSNAMKYAKSGVRPVISIAFRKTNDEYVFSVKDNGIGIEDDCIDKIFNPFFQSHREKSIGQGIGLSNCKNIMESMNGKIWAESKYGEFTNIYFTVPIQDKSIAHLKKNPRPISSDSSIQNSLTPKK